MQKVIRRTLLAKRQAARRNAVRAGKSSSDARELRKMGLKRISQSLRADTQAARVARREDWLLGPLAPRRDAGDAREAYGAVDTVRMQSVEKVKGTWRRWGIVEGDRVVIVQEGHRERGFIGIVSEVREKSEDCIVRGLNKADVRIPEHMLAKEADKTPFRAFERPLPLASVRLVAPLPHSETGVLRDVVINELKLKKTSIAELRGDEEPSRFIAGLEPPTRIPYPEVEPETFEDHDDDTLRIEVESKTWVPTLLSPPMPPSIIDELRNKYSRFRDRHDDAYIARKLREDEEALERTKTGKKMMTPLKELRKKERMENKARGKPVLGEEMLAKIGEVMARNQARASTGQDMEAVG